MSIRPTFQQWNPAKESTSKADVMAQLPDWDDLPEVKGMPRGCTWGLFDKDGKKDVFGTLNILTKDVVQAAFAEARDGISVSLNWPLGAVKTPGFARKPSEHKVLAFSESPFPCHAFDDEVSFNTQTSSQWDSLAHYLHQATQQAYNGIKVTKDVLVQDFGDEDKEHKYPTLNHWHERGGVVARGVLIDYKAYADAHGIKYNLFNNDQIKIEDIEKIAQYQGVEFKLGDILIVRSGFTEALGAMTAEQQDKAMSAHRVVGVEGTERAAKWIWNKHFAAVAGDMIAFENLPPIVDGKEGTVKDLVLHSYLISLLGMSIGELWDLKALSEYCAKVKRYSFLLTSVPLNQPGAVGSPPNVLAIF